jgi:hypothetical protein
MMMKVHIAASSQQPGEVAQIAKNRVIVGHDIVNDLQALQLDHPSTHIRDTASYEPFLDPRTRGKRKLKTLAALHLGLDIQRRGVSRLCLLSIKMSMLIYYSRNRIRQETTP